MIMSITFDIIISKYFKLYLVKIESLYGICLVSLDVNLFITLPKHDKL